MEDGGIIGEVTEPTKFLARMVPLIKKSGLVSESVRTSNNETMKQRLPLGISSAPEILKGK